MLLAAAIFYWIIRIHIHIGYPICCPWISSFLLAALLPLSQDAIQLFNSIPPLYHVLSSLFFS